MKIEKSGNSVKVLSKEETNVGQVYEAVINKSIFIRCQGGFVNMATGTWSDYAETPLGAQFIHLSEAVLVVPA